MDKIEIINRALICLGANPINDMDSAEPTAELIKAVYTQTKNAEIAAYRWNFALKRTALAALSIKPEWGYEFMYQLPSDFLRLEFCEDEDYAIEGDKLLCNFEPPLRIRYLRKFEEDSLLPELFIEVFSYKLAIKICEKGTQDGGKLNMLYNEYHNALREAKKANAIQNAAQAIKEGRFISERF